jgi:uncharacterized protein YwbE
MVSKVTVCRPLQRRRRVGTIAIHNSEATVARNVANRSLSKAHVVGVKLLEGMVSKVSACRPLQRRRRVETIAIHNSEATVARNVGSRSLSKAHVIGVRLLNGMVSKVTLCRPLQRRRRVATVARNVGNRSLSKTYVFKPGC